MKFKLKITRTCLSGMKEGEIAKENCNKGISKARFIDKVMRHMINFFFFLMKFDKNLTCHATNNPNTQMPILMFKNHFQIFECCLMLVHC